MLSNEVEIHTGDEVPRRVAMHRMPFAVQQEIAKQLHNMQGAGVIESFSKSSGDGLQKGRHLKILHGL